MLALVSRNIRHRYTGECGRMGSHVGAEIGCFWVHAPVLARLHIALEAGTRIGLIASMAVVLCTRICAPVYKAATTSTTTSTATHRRAASHTRFHQTAVATATVVTVALSVAWLTESCLPCIVAGIKVAEEAVGAHGLALGIAANWFSTTTTTTRRRKSVV